MPNRPPKSWWNSHFKEVLAGLRKAHPDWSASTLNQRARQTTGNIWHNVMTPAQRQSRTQAAEKMYSAFRKSFGAKWATHLTKQFMFKDFGGWTSQNADWERGYREGERKQEDRERGIPVQRNRLTQYRKQYDQLTYATEADNQVRQEQKKQRQQALRYRAGEGKEQHKKPGAYPVAPGGPTTPKPVAFKPKPPAAAMKYFRSEHYGLYMPFQVLTATKNSLGVERGDLVIEGIISMPIKDLQGDVLELPALIKAKDAITAPNGPYNKIWLDHESPYAKPQNNQETPAIAKFVAAKILRIAGMPALWGRAVVNKMHPKFEQVAYELKKGFYNAFSMEFVPIREGLKFVDGKMANAISDIKYFATSLVRAPANEGATIQKVYVKSFTNTHSGFYPVRITGPGWIGQTVKTKGNLENLAKRKELEPEEEPEDEPELEPELELEEEPEEEPEATMDGQPAPAPLKKRVSRRDYDRETGTTAAERASTAIGEWGDPALEKRRATMKASINDRLTTVEKALLQMNKNLALMGKALGFKGIDSGEALDTIDEENAGDFEEEQEPPETKPGKLKPRKQRVISTFPEGAGDTEDVEGQEVGGEPVGKYIADLVRKTVQAELPRRIVARKGYGAEEQGVVSEQMRTKQLMDKVSSDGSIESQLALWGL